MRLLVTRPEPEARRTAEALAALGHEAVVSPLLRLVIDREARIPPCDGKGRVWQALLLTSANTAKALAAHSSFERLKALPVVAVGERTARAARAAGFRSVRSAEGDAEALAAFVVVHLDPGAGPLLNPGGEARAGDLAGHLGRAGFTVVSPVLYRMQAEARLSSEAAAALSASLIDAVLLYSPASRDAFLAAAARQGVATPPSLAFLCLSEAIAAPLRARAAGRVIVAERPDEAHLLAALAHLAAPAGDAFHEAGRAV